jgi:MSHA biogenesis protein MshM
MYREFFKLREHPFSLTPDTDFWFGAAGHRDAMNVLCAMLRLGEGFIKVSGEIGLGKTLLCRQLLKELDNQFLTAYIPDPQLSPYGLVCAVADEIGAGTLNENARDRLMTFIRNRLLYLAQQGKRVVLVIDEAHQLPDVTFETLRLLTNLETEKYKLLQVVIVGQPELDIRLAQPSMRQLNQRISFTCTLSPMSFSATQGADGRLRTWRAAYYTRACRARHRRHANYQSHRVMAKSIRHDARHAVPVAARIREPGRATRS